MTFDKRNKLISLEGNLKVPTKPGDKNGFHRGHPCLAMIHTPQRGLGVRDKRKGGLGVKYCNIDAESISHMTVHRRGAGQTHDDNSPPRRDLLLIRWGNGVVNVGRLLFKILDLTRARPVAQDTIYLYLDGNDC
jgi:hypothetical protein